MNCKDCPNWNEKFLTCKLNPDVKRDKNGTCGRVPSTFIKPDGTAITVYIDFDFLSDIM